MNEIIHGDALEVLEGMTYPQEPFGCVVTSPPYNLGHSNAATRFSSGIGRKRRWQGEYIDFDDRLDTEEYVNYHRQVVAQCLRLLADDGLMWYVHRRKSKFMPDGLPPLVEQVLAGMPVRAEIIWDKKGPGAGFCAAGVDGPAYYPTHSYESIFLLAKTKAAGMDRKIAAQGDIWHIRRQPVPGHPCAFPLALAIRCIQATCNMGPVLDPFMGTGTTAIAAASLGREYLGIEMGEKYVTVAQRRIAGLTMPLIA